MDLLNIFYTGVGAFINIIFVLLPLSMRFLAFSLLMMTVSKCLKRKKGWKWMLVKIAHTIFYMGFMIWKFGVLDLHSLPEKILIVVFMLMIFLVIIVMYIKTSIAFFGKQIINYYTIWLFYFIALVIVSFLDFQIGAWGFSIFYLALSLVAIKLSGNEVNGL